MRDHANANVHPAHLVVGIIESTLDQWLYDPAEPAEIGYRWLAIHECAGQIVDLLRQRDSR